MSLLTILAPSDAQLLTIAHMCDERGLERPQAIYSKEDASSIIGAILHGQYDPDFHRVGSPTFYGLDADDTEIPF